MKPHEENWTVSARQNTYCATGPGVEALKRAGLPIEFEALSIGQGDRGPQVALIPLDESSPERARLAAQAPAMARLLLKSLDSTQPIGFHEVETVLRDAGVIE